jgi:hypothetical protein
VHESSGWKFIKQLKSSVAYLSLGLERKFPICSCVSSALLTLSSRQHTQIEEYHVPPFGYIINMMV